MAERARKLTVVIAGEDKTKPTFKDVEKSGDHLSEKLKKAGKDSGRGFGDGFRKEMPSRKTGEELGESIGGGLKKVLAGAGIAAAAVFAVGFMQELDNEFAVDKLQAQLGSGEWAQDAGEVAGDLYLDAFGESVADNAAVVKGVIQFGLIDEGASKDALRGISEDVATFTDVLDQDLNMTLQATSAIMRNGLAKDGAEALDILTVGIQSGTDRAEDLLETFQEYSSLFRDLGLDAREATGLLRQGLQGGARDADKVADALKEFAIRGQDASETSAEGFEMIGLSAEEMTEKVAAGGETAHDALRQVLTGLRNIEDPVKRNAAAVALFGTQAEDLGDALFSLDLDTAATALGDTAGKTDELGSAYDNAKTRIEEFKREALDKVTTFIGEQVIPRLEDLAHWIGENEGKAKLAAGVIGGALVIAMTAYAVSAASAAVATIAATWPILLIVAAVGALAYGLWYAYENFGWFKTGVNGIIGAVQKAIGWVQDLAQAIDRVTGAFYSLQALTGSNNSGQAAYEFVQENKRAAKAVTRPLKGMAEGGIVKHRPGGIVANIGEGRYDEAVIPLDGREMGGMMQPVPVVVELDGKVLGRAMIRFEADYKSANGKPAFGRG